MPENGIKVYEALAYSSLEWVCCQCGQPNYSSSLFEATIPESSNSFSILTSSNSNSGAAVEDTTPILRSTPRRLHKDDKECETRRNKLKQQRKSVKIIIINFQSITNKKEAVLDMLESVKPDIIIGTETWLSNDVNNSELFPVELYEVEREDRQDGHGGVLLVVKKGLNPQKISIKDAGEEVWVKISRKRKSPIIIGSLYRPPKSDTCKIYVYQLKP